MNQSLIAKRTTITANLIYSSIVILCNSCGIQMTEQDASEHNVNLQRDYVRKFSIDRKGIHLGFRWGFLYDALKNNPSAIKYRLMQRLVFPPDSEMLQGIYEDYGEFLPRKGKLVVDIGAQYADYSILCNRKYGAVVVAFEPLKQNYYRGLYLIRINRASVDFRNLAVSDTGKEEEVFSDNTMLRSSNDGKVSEKVKFVTLDSLSLEPDILKVDVEGFEMNVLKGGAATIRRFLPRIIIETHSSSLEAEVKGFLLSMGYELKHEGRRVNGIGWMDTIVNLFFLPGDLRQ